jgi:hypothetical protein
MRKADGDGTPGESECEEPARLRRWSAEQAERESKIKRDVLKCLKISTKSGK